MTGAAGTAPAVDAHLHVWDLDTGEYTWLTPAHGPLHRTIDGARAERELRAAGVPRAVLVQADDTDADTDLMLATAREHPWVAGVVGWVPLTDPTAAADRLDGLAGALCGVRQLLHAEPRARRLVQPEVHETLRRVAAHGLAFDVPDAWPALLPDVPAVADAVPDLVIVLDHLGKPPADPSALPLWRARLAEVAHRPLTVAKLSGLQHVPTAALPTVVDTALELFGPDRLLWGGDWPMTLSAGGYPATLGRTLPLLDALSPGERDAVLGGTATRVYGLAPPPAGAADLDTHRPRHLDAEETT